MRLGLIFCHLDCDESKITRYHYTITALPK
jgi:hypothetical protein